MSINLKDIMSQQHQRTTPRTSTLAAVAASLLALSAAVAQAQYGAVWNDSYLVSTTTNDVNFEYNSPTRQGGMLASIDYFQSPAGPHFRHQLKAQAGDTLQLAGNNNVATNTGMASPNYNFTNMVNGGPVSKVSFKMRQGWVNNVPTNYTWTTFTMAGDAPLLTLTSPTNHLGVTFVHDTLNGVGDYMQVYDGTNLAQNVVRFPAGVYPSNQLDVAFTFSDPNDGNPWNGFGSTVTRLYINNTLVTTYTKTNGGYTNNYMTMQGGPVYTSGSTAVLGINSFDDLTVYSTLVSLSWGVGDGVWDINATANWNNGVGLVVYYQGAPVFLDDTASGTSPINITLNSTVTPDSVTANLTNKNYSISGSGTIAGAAALIKNGSGTLTLSNASTYTGSTLINAGTLALKGTATISGTTNVSIEGGATLDASGLASPLDLGAAQKLTGSAATGTLKGNVNLRGALALNYASGQPTLTVTQGGLNLSNNPVTVTVTGSPLEAGGYTLISTGAGGSVTGTLPGTVAVGGSGTAPGTTASLAIVGGSLVLNVTALTGPATNGLVLWLTPETLTNTVAYSPVSTWASAVGTGNTATNGIAGSQPTFFPNGINGYPVVRFENSAALTNFQWLASPLSLNANSNSITAIVVFDSQITGARDSVLCQLGVNGQSLIYVQTNSAPAPTPSLGSSASGQNLPAAQIYTTRNWSILALVQNTAAGTLTLYENGSLIASNAIGTVSAPANAGWALGANSALTGDGLNGDIAEVMLYSAALNTADLASSTYYLKLKYGFMVLTDNFSTPDTMSLNDNLAARQSGVAAPAGYYWQQAQIVNNQVQLQVASSGIESISPNVNFLTNESGTFELSYDITSLTTNVGGNFNSWVGTVIRNGTFNSAPISPVGFDTRIFRNGGSIQDLSGVQTPDALGNRGMTPPFRVKLSALNNVLSYRINDTLVGIYNLPAAAKNVVSISLWANEAATATIDNFSFTAIPQAKEILPSYPATAILSDAFQTPDNADINSTVAARQTGLAAPVIYVGTNETVSITGNSLTMAPSDGTSYAAPALNVQPYEDANSFRLRFTAAGSSSGAGDFWMGVRFCDNAIGPRFVNSTNTSALGLILFPGNGQWTLFDTSITNQQIAAGFVTPAGSYAFDIQVVSNVLAIQINGQTLAVGAGNRYSLAARTGNYITLQSRAATGVTGAAQFDALLIESLQASGGGPVTIPPPYIASISLAGSDLVINGTNGLAGASYITLTSTNVATPLNQWSPLGTNVLGANGPFTINVTNAVTPGVPQQFYILRAN